MSEKNIKLGAILLIMIFVAYLYQGPWQAWRTEKKSPKNFFAKIDFSKVDKLEIFTNNKATTLEKNKDRWLVGGTKDFFVNQELISEIFDKFEQTKLAKLELAGTTKEKKQSFMTDQNGIRVNVFQAGNKILDFIIGKMSNDYLGVYLALPDSNDTFYLGVDLFGPFSQEDWRDKTIFSVDKDLITQIRFQYPRQEFSVGKKDDAWQGISPRIFPVDKGKIEEILAIMSSLQASSIPEQKFDGTDLEKNLIIVSATGEGIDNTIMVGRSNRDGYYYAKRADSDNIYLITKEQQALLVQKIETLK